MYKNNKIILSLTIVSMFFLFSACSSGNMEKEPPANLQLEVLDVNNNQSINNNINKYMVNPENFSDLVSQYSRAKIKTNLGDIELNFYNQEIGRAHV